MRTPRVRHDREVDGPEATSRYHFVLVIPADVRDHEHEASLRAEQHLVDAFRDGASPQTVAERLRSVGYVSVDGFRVVADSSTRGDDFRPAFDTQEWADEGAVPAAGHETGRRWIPPG